MSPLIAAFIADFLIARLVIKEEERNVVIYGLELIISGIFSVLLVLFLGSLIKEIGASIIYNLMMVLIRMYTGGFHANTHFRCNVCYGSFYVIVVEISKYIKKTKGTFLAVLMSIISLLVIYFFSPLEHHNKKLDVKQKKKYKIISISLYVISIGAAMILFIMSSEFSTSVADKLVYYGICINVILSMIAILLLIGKKKEGYYYEKGT